MKKTVLSFCVSWLFGLAVFHAPVVLADLSPLSPAMTPQSIRLHHQRLVDMSSAAGGFDSGVRLNETGIAVARYLRDGYLAAGLSNARMEPFQPNKWWPESYRLELLEQTGTSAQELTSFPVWYSEAADDLELELVYAGYGTSGELRGLDVKGKAVLIDMKRLLHFVPSWHPKLTDAMNNLKRRGAAAIITAETRVELPTGAIVGDAGAISNGQTAPAELFPLPVLAIGKSDGERLKQRIQAGTTFVRLNLEYSLAPTTAYNVIAELPGNGKIDEYIVIGGHYDSWFSGAIDNLGSQAALLEMARYFSAIPQHKRDRHIVFASLFGHELNNHGMGHAQFVDDYNKIFGKITCFLNVDGSGSWGWEERADSGDVFATDREDKGAIVATSHALSALAFEAIYKYHPQGPATWMQFPLNFYVSDTHENIGEAGIPAVQMINKHIYYHSPLDTLDRIAPEHVYKRTLMNIDVAQKLLASEPGYYINSNANPHRQLVAQKDAAADLHPDELPANPNLWQSEPPNQLDMHVIPTNVRVFSPVIAWSSFWSSDSITQASQVSWRFDSLLDLLGPKQGFFAGSMYLLPGQKQLTMSVTDSQGRSTQLVRNIEVRAGWFWLLYCVLALLLCGLLVWIGQRFIKNAVQFSRF